MACHLRVSQITNEDSVRGAAAPALAISRYIDRRGLTSQYGSIAASPGVETIG
jgi:hypothetical protein